MNSKKITEGAMVAALYILLSLISNAAGIGSGVIQIRLSEALCILPCFIPSSVWGLFVGCLLSNILSGCVIWDVIFGSLATLIGAAFTYKLKRHRFLATVSPIISNTVIIPFILAYAYKFEGSVLYFMFTVGIGEIISCGFLGTILFSYLKKYKNFF